MSKAFDAADIQRLSLEGGAAFDGFNEDLVWILDKLVERTGGLGGVMSGHLSSGSPATLLATSSSKAPSPPLVAELLHRAGGALEEPATHHDRPVIGHSLLNHHGQDGDTRRYRILQLTFSPTDGVKVVATVAKESRLGFNVIEAAMARRLYPVLSRYVRLWWAHRNERRKALTLRAIIDGSDVGIVLLNRHGDVLLVNSRARGMLETRDGLLQQDGKLSGTSDKGRQSLEEAIRLTTQENQSAAPAGCSARAPRMLQLQRCGRRRDLIAMVAPAANAAIDGGDPASILYVLDPDREIEQLLAPVYVLYKLTPTEARLAGHLVAGRPIADAAACMQIRSQTARAYLKQVFHKTQTHRQAELVRVMLISALRTLVP